VCGRPKWKTHSNFSDHLNHPIHLSVFIFNFLRILSFNVSVSFSHHPSLSSFRFPLTSRWFACKRRPNTCPTATRRTPSMYTVLSRSSTWPNRVIVSRYVCGPPVSLCVQFCFVLLHEDISVDIVLCMFLPPKNISICVSACVCL
jgi:hypothetical protein